MMQRGKISWLACASWVSLYDFPTVNPTVDVIHQQRVEPLHRRLVLKEFPVHYLIAVHSGNEGIDQHTADRRAVRERRLSSNSSASRRDRFRRMSGADVTGCWRCYAGMELGNSRQAATQSRAKRGIETTLSQLNIPLVCLTCLGHKPGY